MCTMPRTKRSVERLKRVVSSLDLSGTHSAIITEAELESLELGRGWCRLRSLNLRGCSNAVTDAGLRSLLAPLTAALTNLKGLDITGELGA